MCHHKNLTGLPKHFPKKIDEAQCTIFYTETIKTLPKGKTVETTNLQPGEIIHMDFAFYNVTPILGFTSMLDVVC